MRALDATIETVNAGGTTRRIPIAELHRLPGATPDAIDISFFGQNPSVPPYQHDPRDDNEECSAKLGESFAAILGGAQGALTEQNLKHSLNGVVAFKIEVRPVLMCMSA